MLRDFDFVFHLQAILSALDCFHASKGLRRYYGNGHLQFVTCSCYHRQRWLDSARRRDLFLTILDESRQRYRFVVVGYVVMPEHIHLLIGEPEKGTVPTVMQVVKQGYARGVVKKRQQVEFWAKEHGSTAAEQFAEKPCFCGNLSRRG